MKAALPLAPRSAQLPLPLGREVAPSFDNYLPGGNEQAWLALQAPATRGEFWTLWGPSGCGKSHLLEAYAARQEEQGGQVLRLTPGSRLPIDLDAPAVAVVIDDVDRMGAEHQHAAFVVWVHAATHGLAVVAACGVPPVDVPVRDDLRTRLGGGTVFQLRPLDEAEARAVLVHQAHQRGLELPPETLDYLWGHCARDLAHLSGLVRRLDDYALVRQRKNLTIPLFKQMLAEQETA